jgi:hypothetical protein
LTNAADAWRFPLPIVGNATEISPVAITPKVVVAPIANHQIVIVHIPAITQSIAPNVANASASRTTSINAAVARIVAINELATFFVVLSGVIPITTGGVAPDAGRAITLDAI